MAGKYEKKPEAAEKGEHPLLAVLRSIFTWLLVIASVAMMLFTVFSVRTFDRNDRTIFGYKLYTIRSDSMSATDFNAGDLIFVKEVDPRILQPGDIISYSSVDPDNFGATVTHKIRSLTADAQGAPGFITYGTTTGIDDAYVVAYAYVLGKYEGRIPGVGTFFTFLKTTPGYICCIFLPFLLLILSQGYQSIRLFRQYKAEQLAELQARKDAQQAALEAERAALAQERKRQEEMLQKLMELQSQLQSKQEE